MFANDVFYNFQSLAILDQVLFSKLLKLCKCVFQKLKRMSLLLVVLLKLKLEFDCKQNVSFVFSYDLFS